MADFSRTHGSVTITLTDAYRVAVTVTADAPPLTPGEAATLAESLKEAANLAVAEMKEEAARLRAVAETKGPKNDDMW